MYTKPTHVYLLIAAGSWELWLTGEIYVLTRDNLYMWWSYPGLVHLNANPCGCFMCHLCTVAGVLPIVTFWVLNGLLMMLETTGRPKALLKYKIQHSKPIPVTYSWLLVDFRRTCHRFMYLKYSFILVWCWWCRRFHVCQYTLVLYRGFPHHSFYSVSWFQCGCCVVTCHWNLLMGSFSYFLKYTVLQNFEEEQWRLTWLIIS